MLRCRKAAVAFRDGDDLVIEAVGDPPWTAVLGNQRPGRSRLNSLARPVADAGGTSIRSALVIDASRFASPTLHPP